MRWVFQRGSHFASLRRVRRGSRFSLTIDGPDGDTRVVDFEDVLDVVLHQVMLEASWVDAGWSLVEMVPEPEPAVASERPLAPDGSRRAGGSVLSFPAPLRPSALRG